MSAPHPLTTSRDATKKRCREPDSDTVGSAATTKRTKGTVVPADHDVTDGPPSRKKKKEKQNGAPQK